MKDGHTTKSESSFGKKLWCVLIVLFLGVIGWQVWKINAYNNAVRQAKEAGFEWKCDDAISLIRQDWRNALKKETWGANYRVLDMTMKDVRDLGPYREMLHLLRPTVLRVMKCENMDALKDIAGLQMLGLYYCPKLQNIDGLKGLAGLQVLEIRYCLALENVDGLNALASLRIIDLRDCLALENVDGLKGLNNLQTLNLGACQSLQNVNVLKSLSGLHWINLEGCDKIPAATVRELRAVLPKAEIIYHDINAPLSE